MREIRQSGSEGGKAELNRPSLPLSASPADADCQQRLPHAHGLEGRATAEKRRDRSNGMPR